MSESSTRDLVAYLAYVLGMVALVAGVGALGFHYFEHGTNTNAHTMFDAFWWSMVTIATIGYGDIYPQTVGGRLFAMFLMFMGIGVLSVSTAGVAAYLVRFNQIDQMRVRRLRGHVVICGLGRMAWLLTKAFRSAGVPVLVLERNEANPRIQDCRDAGAIVVAANATDPDVLARARLQHARHLLIVCGDDSTNAQVATRAREVVGPRPEKLGCSVQVANLDLWDLLRGWGLATSTSLRLGYFNVDDLAARAMLARVPPFDETAPPAGGRPPHVLIVGASSFANRLIVHVVRQWRSVVGAAGERLRLTIVDEDAAATHDALRRRHPGIDQVAHIVPVSMSHHSSDFRHAPFLLDERHALSVTRVYVCLDEEPAAVSSTLMLLGHLHDRDVPVAVRVDQEEGLALLLQQVRSRDGYRHLQVFGLLEHVCQPDLVTRGENEVLARALHGEYLRSQLALGVGAATNPAAVPWDQLTAELREANRSQADQITSELEAIGCRIGPLLEIEAPHLAFTDEEVERLAVVEHNRWYSERKALGWTLGPRDPVRKTNPNLLPWEQLGDDAKAVTRQLVRQMPASLAAAGFAVHRRASVLVPPRTLEAPVGA